jgi:hypothetical protein
MQLNLTPIESIITTLIGFVNTTLVPVVFALAFVVFIWGVFQYFVAGAANEEKRETGKKFVAYGLIGFVLMLSVWGIVRIVTSTLKFDNSTPDLPTFKKAGS